MSLHTLLSINWSVMAPEFIILGVAALLTVVDLIMPKNQDRKVLGWVAILGVLAALVSLAGLVDHQTTTILNNTFRLDSFAKAFKLLLLGGGALVLFMAVSYKPKDGLEHYEGEFYYLFLTALLGAMMMASSGDLITLFVGLELLSVSSYILAGMRKRNLQSNESAMKYVINGGISTAIVLFGMSYVFGLTGSTNLYNIAVSLQNLSDPQHVYMLGLAFLMIFVGLAFKISAAPFHMWAPDVYQGAPTPVTAFLSVISKTAGFVIIVRVLLSVFGVAATAGAGSAPILVNMHNYISFIAGATMIIGNLVALKQTNIKRLFAYSSIAHAGYILVALAAMNYFMFDAIWFYLLAYLFMNLGAFAVIQLVSEKTGTENISDYAGLYRRSPLLAVAMGILILSLAGFPGTAGFIGKLNIFLGAFADPNNSHYLLASVMIATTVVSYFYYFGVLKQIFFRRSEDESKFNIPFGLLVVIIVGVAGSIWFGLVPNSALDFFHQHFNQFQDFLSK